MDIIEYRKKLGISYCDEEIQNMFISKMQVFFESSTDIEFNKEDEIRLCSDLGIKYESGSLFFSSSFNLKSGLQKAWTYLDKETKDFSTFISALIIFVNGFQTSNSNKELIFNKVKLSLKESHIAFDVIKDDDGLFILPKGVKELDIALIDEPLEWLDDYPESRKEFISALKAYTDFDKHSASDIADKFRKALEQFFREFFKEEKSLENMLNTYGKYLKDHKVPTEIANNFQNLLDGYAKFNNAYAKHRSNTEYNILEYVLYQTGNIIRLLITLSKEK